MKTQIKDIIISEKVKIRKELDKDTIVRYRGILKQLPPIIINQDNFIVDGLHRLSAAKELKWKEIETEIINIDEDDIQAKAYFLNSKHGKSLSLDERNKIIVDMYTRDPKKWTQQHIADSMEISKQRVGQVIKDLESKATLQITKYFPNYQENLNKKRTKAEITEDKMTQIEEELEEELERKPTEIEIADKAEVSRSTVSRKKAKERKIKEKLEKEKEIKLSGENVPDFWKREFSNEFKEDKSLVKLFNLTGYPLKSEDAICPHFLELKWAYGCPYQCAWCYLLGTFRGKTKSNVRNGIQITKEIINLFEDKSLKDRIEVCNTGELSDSIATGGKNLQILMLSLFGEQTDTNHKILFLTKSNQVKHLLNLPDKAKENAIISFSVNAEEVSKQWELKSPSPIERLQAAKEISEARYKVRLRIDPVVPINGWQEKYKQLIQNINFKPERITIGTLRIHNPNTKVYCDKAGLDSSWYQYLDENSKTGWGLKMNHDIRKEVNKFILKIIQDKFGEIEVGFCKETRKMWEELKMDWRNIKCNCVK